jgi:DNA-binding NarL/FixJ family response regulator
VAKRPERVRLLLAYEQCLFREAVKTVLEETGTFIVVAEAGDVTEAVAQALLTHPDVAVVDAGPAVEGVQVVRGIKDHLPDCRILILAAGEDQGTLLEALEAGASGYLTRESPLSDLIEAAHRVHRGDILIPPRMLGGLLAKLIHRHREEKEASRRMALLTRREREVLALLADGAGKVAIARALVISPETARTHVQNIIEKLGVHSRHEAAAFVRQNGFLEELAESPR